MTRPHSHGHKLGAGNYRKASRHGGKGGVFQDTETKEKSKLVRAILMLHRNGLAGFLRFPRLNLVAWGPFLNKVTSGI